MILNAMVRLVIFDLDGTLLNTIADLATAANYALSKQGLHGHSVGEYTKMVGHGVRNMLAAALEKTLGKEPCAVQVDKALEDFTPYYVEHIDVHTEPYPGMVELLNKLACKGIGVAVASNKFQEGTERLIGEFFPQVDFVAVFGNRPGLPLKPCADVVNMILKKAGVERGECLYVGDSATDVKTARNAGVVCAGVTWGFRPESDLMEAGADYIVKSATELAALIF